MNALDMLLSSEELLVKPEKKFTVKRLSKGDVKFELTLMAVSMNNIKHIQQINTKKNELDTMSAHVSMVVYGVSEFDMKNADNKVKLDETFKKVGVSNINDFVSLILLPGEILEISSAISDLSGFEGDTIEEIKNV
jgi:hypothetical protein